MIGRCVYPNLGEWIESGGTTVGQIMDALYLTPAAFRYRLIGTTKWSHMEREKLSEMSGMPADVLFKREED